MKLIIDSLSQNENVILLAQLSYITFHLLKLLNAIYKMIQK